MRYNHAVSLAFEVISNDEYGADITPAMLREALLQRMVNLDSDAEWLDATMPPYDTMEHEEDNT